MEKRFKNIKDGFENEQKLWEKYFDPASAGIRIQRKPIEVSTKKSRYSEAKYSNCHLGKGVLDYLFSEIKETLQVHEHEHLRWLHLFRKNEATAVYTEPGLLYT